MKQAKPMLRLFTANYGRDEVAEKLEWCFVLLQNLVSGLSEKEAHGALNAAVAKGSQSHEEISFGLLAGILSDPTAAARYYRDLTFISRDGLNLILNQLNLVILDKYPKLHEVTRIQLLWLLKEMIKNNIVGVDESCYNVLRQIAGGDISHKNIWLAESMLDIFIEYRSWLEKFPILVATVVYSYLRLIVDHGGQTIVNLRQREVDFTVSLLREKFSECLVIGRDLVRLLQNVARIPEFEKLWNDILHNPSTLSPGFTGLLQMMTMRTSKIFLLSRLTPGIEKKMWFLSQLLDGNHRRYQDWFHRQYLATPESQSLRCDLIRFIIGVIHPTDDMLGSKIIPRCRWEIIRWLLTTCTSNVAASNAKLSLFYDWLFYDPENDDIMNIEPAILVMYNSMCTHPTITATLLDFLFKIIPNFYPPLIDRVRLGIVKCLRQILEKEVLLSLSSFFNNPELDKELRGTFTENFAEFYPTDEVIKIEEPIREVTETIIGNHVPDNGRDFSEFGDDEDDIPLAKVRLLRDMKFKPIREAIKRESVDISEYVENLEGDIKKYTLQLQAEKENKSSCEIMEKLVQSVMQEKEFDQNSASILATCLCALLRTQFNQNFFPDELDEDCIEDSIGTPLFVMFRNLCQMPEEDPSRQPILMLLTEIYSQQVKLGYQLLYFLKVSKLNDDKMSTYRDFCKTLKGKGLISCLLNDLRHCQDDDVRLFCFLIPDIYTQFSNIAIGNAELLNLIVACIDSCQLQELICIILQGNMVMFKKDSFLSILNASLEWESFEQYFLWKLITAHNIPVDYILPILPKLEYSDHAEALTSILLLLKQEKPTAELLKHVTCREVKQQDYFVVSVLKYWSQEHEEKLAELISTQLTKFNTSPGKRKRQANRSQGPNVAQTLAHLDQLRHNCKQISFFKNEIIQQALHQIQNTSSEVLKTKYSDLFSLVEDLDDSRIPHIKLCGNRKTVTGQKRNKKKQPHANFSDESEENSEGDEILKQKPTKKRKRAQPIDSDSD